MTPIKNNNDRNGNRTSKPRSKVTAIDPKQDGVTHVNVYSRGKTELGKFLSNFPRHPFKHPKYGNFDSLEGFWHWLSTGKIYDEFRKLSNLEAKVFAKGKSYVDLPDFHEEIKFAIECKIEAYPLFKAKLLLNKLPLRHYFVFKGKNAGDPDRVVDQPQFNWQIKHIEALVEKWRNQ